MGNVTTLCKSEINKQYKYMKRSVYSTGGSWASYLFQAGGGGGEPECLYKINPFQIDCCNSSLKQIHFNASYHLLCTHFGCGRGGGHDPLDQPLAGCEQCADGRCRMLQYCILYHSRHRSGLTTRVQSNLQLPSRLRMRLVQTCAVLVNNLRLNV